jgi:diadenosine tetraphosphate (Ap4A) HIT family hydrolase
VNDRDGSACFACDLASGARPLIGGRIAETETWVVEHCMGPLGVGTLIVKPKRHILHVWDLSSLELEEMGPLLGDASTVVREITACDQVYVCLWSHGNFEPVHIHFVVQPVHRALKQIFVHAGPSLQTQMFERGEMPDPVAVETFCDNAREVFGTELADRAEP